MSLEEKLSEVREGAAERIPRQALEVMHRVTRELEESGQAEEALGRGDTAPDFELPDPDGRMVSSEALRRDGPLVVTFYRGVW